MKVDIFFHLCSCYLFPKLGRNAVYRLQHFPLRGSVGGGKTIGWGGKTGCNPRDFWGSDKCGELQGGSFRVRIEAARYIIYI